MLVMPFLFGPLNIWIVITQAYDVFRTGPGAIVTLGELSLFKGRFGPGASLAPGCRTQCGFQRVRSEDNRLPGTPLQAVRKQRGPLPKAVPKQGTCGVS